MARKSDEVRTNDKGGVELRSKPYKGGTSPKWITTHLGIANAPTVIFEGFMDMLSFATLCGEVRHNYITLNSIVNTPAAIEVLRSMGGKVLLCLDNDEGGEKCTSQMLDALPSAVDIRSRFAPAKDVNDYLVRRNNRSNSPCASNSLSAANEEEEEEEEEEEVEQPVRRGWRR